MTGNKDIGFIQIFKFKNILIIYVWCRPAHSAPKPFSLPCIPIPFLANGKPVDPCLGTLVKRTLIFLFIHLQTGAEVLQGMCGIFPFLVNESYLKRCSRRVILGPSRTTLY